MSVTLAGINLHPVKSTAIRPVEAAYVGRAGLLGDRCWMVVDAAGEVVNATACRSLFRIVAENRATDPDCGADLVLTAPGADPLLLDEPQPEPGVGARDVRLWDEWTVPARAAGEEADAWLRGVLGRDDVSLVWCPDPAQRLIKPSLAASDDHAAFQDNSPVSLASAASMAQVNTWIGDPEPLPVSRFRANLVVAGDLAPFAEDDWDVLRVGEAVLRVAGPIDRCAMTTLDAETLASGKDPIRTLAAHRRWEGKTWFAVHLMVQQPGRVAVGDEVTVD